MRAPPQYRIPPPDNCPHVLQDQLSKVRQNQTKISPYVLRVQLSKVRQRSAPMSSRSSCQKSDSQGQSSVYGSVNKGAFFWNLHNKVFIWSQNTSELVSLLKFRKEGMQSFTILPQKWSEVQGVNAWWPPSPQQQGSWPWPRLSVFTIFHTLQRTNQKQ